MSIDKEILECELEYTKCFSEFYENEDVIRFRDNELKDMYYHNFTYIKKAVNGTELKGIIEGEISLRLSEKTDFCNILMNSSIDNSLFAALSYKPRISVNGYYLFDIAKFPELKALPGCVIKKVSHQEQVKDVLYCDLQHDEETLGAEFCKRRCCRRGKVYLSDKGVNSYVCYHDGEIIGRCDMFSYKGVAKIEDFGVIPTYQRKGYGTTILKHLIDAALKENCHTIYLVTDEEDTAKEMYQKNRFDKIGERTDLFFRI